MDHPSTRGGTGEQPRSHRLHQLQGDAHLQARRHETVTPAANDDKPSEAKMTMMLNRQYVQSYTNTLDHDNHRTSQSAPAPTHPDPTLEGLRHPPFYTPGPDLTQPSWTVRATEDNRQQRPRRICIRHAHLRPGAGPMRLEYAEAHRAAMPTTTDLLTDKDVRNRPTPAMSISEVTSRPASVAGHHHVDRARTGRPFTAVAEDTPNVGRGPLVLGGRDSRTHGTVSGVAVGEAWMSGLQYSTPSTDHAASHARMAATTAGEAAVSGPHRWSIAAALHAMQTQQARVGPVTMDVAARSAPAVGQPGAGRLSLHSAHTKMAEHMTTVGDASRHPPNHLPSARTVTQRPGRLTTPHHSGARLMTTDLVPRASSAGSRSVRVMPTLFEHSAPPAPARRVAHRDQETAARLAGPGVDGRDGEINLRATAGPPGRATDQTSAYARATIDDTVSASAPGRPLADTVSPADTASQRSVRAGASLDQGHRMAAPPRLNASFRLSAQGRLGASGSDESAPAARGTPGAHRRAADTTVLTRSLQGVAGPELETPHTAQVNEASAPLPDVERAAPRSVVDYRAGAVRAAPLGEPPRPATAPRTSCEQTVLHARAASATGSLAGPAAPERVRIGAPDVETLVRARVAELGDRDQRGSAVRP